MINYLSSLAMDGKIRTSFCLFDGKKCKPDTFFVKKDYRNVIMEGGKKSDLEPAGAGSHAALTDILCGMRDGEELFNS